MKVFGNSTKKMISERDFYIQCCKEAMDIVNLSQQ